MMIDSRSVPENKTIEADVCVVGAGVAGITLARECIGAGFRVCLLESGGLKPDKVTQSLYWGENIGHPYYPLDTSRARFFGGTTHFWHVPIGDGHLGARLRALDAIDFEKRAWVPYSGWPFAKTHLDPFYARAHSVCQIGPFSYEPDDWGEVEKTPRLPLANGRVKTTVFQFGRREVFFDDYMNEILRAENVATYLHANVVDIETTESTRAITRLRVATLEGNRFWAKAGLFVLALGGIETPRLLLLSNKAHSAGLGNQHDLVGRFFMEHPHLWSGKYVLAKPGNLPAADLYRIHTVNKIPVMGKLTLSEEVLRRETLLNYCVSIHPSSHTAPSEGVDSLKALWAGFRHAGLPDDFGKHLGRVVTDIDGVVKKVYKQVRKPKRVEVYRLNTMSEQSPNPDSRVTLGAERDALGQRRVQLDWQPTPADMRSIIRSQEIIDEELRRAGLGWLKIELADDTPPPDLHGGWHHMGTTRMHMDSRKGVVDENCRIHGISNLFVAGSSVFPTVGYANPVLTIVALALRLGDHLKKLLA